MRRVRLHDTAVLPIAPSIPGAIELTEADHELVAAANAVLERHYKTFWHTVAAAIRGKDGRIWTGLHIGTTVGRLAVCAEAVAFGRAVLEGDGTIESAVAVRHPKPEETDRELAVVPPCGACREMVLDHAPDAFIIVKASEGAPVSGFPTSKGIARRAVATNGLATARLVKVTVQSLLPLPYRR